MGPISSTSPNVTDLLQTLSTEEPELSSILSTPSLQAALEKASPGDLVQLSDQALQLQQVGLLFGSADGTEASGLNSLLDSLFPGQAPQGSSNQPDPLLQALDSSLGISGANAITPGSAPSTQIATSAGGFQAQELNALFAAAQPANPSFDTLG